VENRMETEMTRTSGRVCFSCGFHGGFKRHHDVNTWVYFAISSQLHAELTWVHFLKCLAGEDGGTHMVVKAHGKAGTAIVLMRWWKALLQCTNQWNSNKNQAITHGRTTHFWSYIQYTVYIHHIFIYIYTFTERLVVGAQQNTIFSLISSMV